MEYGLVGFLTPEAAKASAIEHGFPNAEIEPHTTYFWYFDDGVNDAPYRGLHDVQSSGAHPRSA